MHWRLTQRPYAPTVIRSCIFVFSLGVFGVSCQDAGAPDSRFTITPDTAEILVGDSRQFSAIGASGTVQWSSSNPQVATVVPQTGFVQGLSRGQSVITAATSNRSVSANISVLAPPAIALSIPTVDFTMPIGGADPAPRTVTVSNGGDRTLSGISLGTIAYGQGQPTGWLTPAASGATAPMTVTLTPRAQGFARGMYTAIVPLLAAGVANSPQNIAVSLAVQAPAGIALSRTTVSIPAIPNETKTETVNVTNAGDVALTGLSAAITYTAGQPQGWLQATLTAATAPATLNLVAASGTLGVGTHTATVRVASTVAGVTARDVTVQLVVSPGPSIVFAPTTVSANAASGTNAAQQTVAITNGGSGSLTGLTLGTITFGPGVTNWLTLQLAGGTGPTNLTLTYATASLPAGNYTATVPVLSPVASNSPANLAVSLRVGPPPTISVNPSTVVFSGWGGGSVQGAQAVQLGNGSDTTRITGLSAQIAYTSGTNWLSAQFQGGTTSTPATLLLQPTTTSLTAGTYTATVTVSSGISGVAPRTIAVTYTMQTFTANVYGYINNCASCHSGIGRPVFSGTPSQVYGQVQPYVPQLQCRLFGTCPHGQKFNSNTAMMNAITQWLAAGAPFF